MAIDLDASEIVAGWEAVENGWRVLLQREAA